MTALASGLLMGLLLGAAETVIAVLTGENLAADYLALVVAFDVAGGLAASALASLIQHVVRRRHDYGDRFIPLAAALVLVYTADKVILAAVFRGEPVAFAVGALAVGFVALQLVGHRVARRARTRDPETSTWVSVTLLIWFLVGSGYWIRRAIHTSPRSAFAATTACALVFVATLVAQDRLLARVRAPKVSTAAFLLATASIAAMGLAFTLAMLPHPALRPGTAVRTVVRASARPNVLLISIDTLRSDHLSLYGYFRDTTPNLRRFARDSVVFTHAVSPGTWTVPGHAAMLTGRFPGGMGALAMDSALPAEAVTLAERLAAAGYRTGAVVANAASLDRRLGWSRGFQFYSDSPRRMFGYEPSLNASLRPWPLLHGRVAGSWRSADQVNDVALAWVAEDDAVPFFLFLNYMDTHDPYVPPDDWPDRYPGRLPFLVDPAPAVLRGQRDLTTAEVRHFHGLYDGAIAYVDAQLGRLLEQLDRRGRLTTTLVVVTSDHGEFFGEHRLMRHELGPYEPVHRIPLLIRYPLTRRTGVEHGWVELIDILPTVLDVVGLLPPEEVDGEVLPRVAHPILVEQAPHPLGGRLAPALGRGYMGLYDGPLKLTRFDDGSATLFDLDQDPTEARDLSGKDQALARVMLERLAAAGVRYPRRHHPPLDPETLERLRAGGYVQ